MQPQIQPENWVRIERLFHGALELAFECRAAYLDSACGSDLPIRREIESLLAADTRSESLAPLLPVGVDDFGVGSRCAGYELLEFIGQGGMGTVYRARETDSGDIVAIKVFPSFPLSEQRRRLLKEAQALSALHHPFVVGVHGIIKAGNRDCLVMEHVAGRTLDRAIVEGGLPVLTALHYARMIAEGIAAAHAAGIIHRDLKPANIIVCENGTIKIIDFGLARITQSTEPPSLSTARGQILGTAAYLSPEQAEGKSVDVRSDLFSFGALFFEMLTGAKAFARESLAATLSAILREAAKPVRALRPEVPRDVARILARCLQKDRDARYESAGTLLIDLRSCERRLSAPPRGALHKAAYGAGLFVLLLACGVLAYQGVHRRRISWARAEIEPQIARLVELRRYNAADELVRRIEPIVPGDHTVREFQRDYRMIASVISVPSGAEIAIKDYSTPDAPWRVLGNTPLNKQTFPIGYLRWRVGAPAYGTREFAETVVLQPTVRFHLDKDTESPAGMVSVPAGHTYGGRPVQVPEFWIDRYEVTNRDYQKFVDTGGYRRPEFWRESFENDGRPLTWEQSVKRFVDETGVAGPANWQIGAYPEGQAKLPVTGVSWYEAAAYARFRGKSLPTFYHWQRAARTELLYADSVLASNFSGKSLAPVGSFRALDRFGTYDMTGNCKEWVWNRADGENRFALGGAWDEAYYASAIPDEVSPMERRSDIGFRCSRYDVSPPAALMQPISRRPVRELAREKPVDDAAFARIRHLYDYPEKPLAAHLEATDESSVYWKKEKVSFAASYGEDRVSAYLFLPRHFAPPYQTVIYFPSGIALTERSSDHLEMWWLDALIRSGRAVLYPVVWGTYERHRKMEGSAVERFRSLLIHEVQDIRRSVDYLQSRGDLDRARVAFFGFSHGAVAAPLVLATEPRFQAAILAVGGLPQGEIAPEVNPLQFARHVNTPVLMLNGRYDVIYAPDISQRLLSWFGTPSENKKFVLLEAGHAMVGFPATTRESLAWLDKYLGPVHPYSEPHS